VVWWLWREISSMFPLVMLMFFWLALLSSPAPGEGQAGRGAGIPVEEMEDEDTVRATGGSITGAACFGKPLE